MYIIGVDIGGTKVKYGLFTIDGKLLNKWNTDTDCSDNGEKILPDIADSIRNTLSEQGISLSDVKGVGLGVPGAVRADNSVNRCTNLGWGDIPAGKMFSKLMDDMPTRLVNDANAAALGEMWQGAGKGCTDIVLATIGTGIGGGVIVDGKVVIGKFSGGGEIGHITVLPDDDMMCSCGKPGCVELHASATGMVMHMKKYLDEHDDDSILRGKEITAKAIFDAGYAGDAPALAVIENCCRLIGMALANIACVVDPQMFVIGGGVSAAGDLLVNTINKYYKKYAFHTSTDTVITKARLGNDAGIYGAAKAILSEI